jgi:hypothetical protein
MKRTLKRELKVLEIAEREAVGPSTRRRRPAPSASQHQFAPRELAPGEVPQPCSGGCLRLKPGSCAAGRTEDARGQPRC